MQVSGMCYTCWNLRELQFPLLWVQGKPCDPGRLIGIQMLVVTSTDSVLLHLSWSGEVITLTLSLGKSPPFSSPLRLQWAGIGIKLAFSIIYHIMSLYSSCTSKGSLDLRKKTRF